ncbi:hypothetical protein ACFL60_08590, partial [Candidatus Omnitrophota bacterium]
YVLAALLVLFMSSVVYAAPVGLTSEADATKGELWANENIGITAGVVVDSLSSRKIDIDSGDFEMDAYGVRIGASFLDRFNVFVDLGQASDMELSYSMRGETVTVKLDDEFMWGIGANALIYRWDNNFELGAHASYRTADMALDEATVAGVNWKRSALTGVSDGEFTEAQGAIELAWKQEVLTPYVGLKYSDVEVDAQFTIAPNLYDAKGKDASQNVGAFIGLAITPKLEGEILNENLLINVEGRFIDEEAVSVGLAYKF